MTKPLQKEYEYFLEVREELAREHDGKFVAIKGQEVLGIYDDYMTAAKSVYVEHEYGTVLMQEIGRDYEYFAAMMHIPGVETLQ